MKCHNQIIAFSFSFNRHLSVTHPSVKMGKHWTAPEIPYTATATQLNIITVSVAWNAWFIMWMDKTKDKLREVQLEKFIVHFFIPCTGVISRATKTGVISYMGILRISLGMLHGKPIFHIENSNLISSSLGGYENSTK